MHETTAELSKLKEDLINEIKKAWSSNSSSNKGKGGKPKGKGPKQKANKEHQVTAEEGNKKQDVALARPLQFKAPAMTVVRGCWMRRQARRTTLSRALYDCRWGGASPRRRTQPRTL